MWWMGIGSSIALAPTYLISRMKFSFSLNPSSDALMNGYSVIWMHIGGQYLSFIISNQARAAASNFSARSFTSTGIGRISFRPSFSS